MGLTSTMRAPLVHATRTRTLGDRVMLTESLRNVVAFTIFEAKRRHGPAQPVTRPPLAACRPISPSSGRISATK